MPHARAIDRLIDVPLRSGLFVSACAIALAWETTRLSHAQPPRPIAFYAFVFFATWASYRLHAVVAKVRGALRGDGSAARVPTRSLLSTFAAFAGTLIFLPLGVRWSDWPSIACSSLLATLYCVPAWPRGPALREFGLAKITVLAGVWTLVTAYLPAVGAPTATLLYLCARRFAFMFALCVAFDVRDAAADARGGIRTVAVLLGNKQSYRLMRGTLLAFAALTLAGPFIMSEPYAGRASLALLTSAALTWGVIEWTRRPATTHRYYLGCVDGMMLVQCLLVNLVTHVR